MILPMLSAIGSVGSNAANNAYIPDTTNNPNPAMQLIVNQANMIHW